VEQALITIVIVGVHEDKLKAGFPTSQREIQGTNCQTGKDLRRTSKIFGLNLQSSITSTP